MTKQLVISLHDSIFVDSHIFSLDTTECFQFHSSNAVMKLFTPSCLESFSLEALIGPFTFVETISNGLLLNWFVHWFLKCQQLNLCHPRPFGYVMVVNQLG